MITVLRVTHVSVWRITVKILSALGTDTLRRFDLAGDVFAYISFNRFLNGANSFSPFAVSTPSLMAMNLTSCMGKKISE